MRNMLVRDDSIAVPAPRPSDVATLAIPELGEMSPQPHLPDVIRRSRAASLRGVLAADAAARAVERLHSVRHLWEPGPVHDEYNFGSVFYAHAMNKNISDYFDRADMWNQRMRDLFPELVDCVFGLCRRLLGSAVSIRPGWTGPSFVVFGEESISSADGGTFHIDWEGLARWDDPRTTDLLSSPDLTAYSFVLMLQTAESGGTLRIWDKRYDRARHDEFIPDPPAAPSARSMRHVYGIGDLVIIDAVTMHQIEPYRGGSRVSLNWHVIRRPDGWHLWF